MKMLGDSGDLKLKRRTFLKLSGASGLAIGFTLACGSDKRSHDDLSGIAFRRFLFHLFEYSPVIIDESYS